jgi:hypothetical protein
MDTRATTATATATIASASDPASHTATGHTPATMADIKVWYILMDENNVPFGDPHPVYLRHDDDILKLKEKIKEGPYDDNLALVKITDMDVWKCNSLTLRGINPDGIKELVGNLEFPRDGQKLGVWLPATELGLQEYQPLVVKVLNKGVHLLLRIMFPTECLK